MASSTHPISGLGLGTIGFGRPWGHPQKPAIETGRAHAVLRRLVDLGIHVIDTAPAYGRSEASVGGFLRGLPTTTRNGLTVVTKFGEHWDPSAGTTYVDFSYDALMRSLERSLAFLGRIDILQVHKADVDVLADAGVRRALAAARSAGVQSVGASVKDVAAVEFVMADDLLSVVQLPINTSFPVLCEAAARAAAAGVVVIVNRPFGMGTPEFIPALVN